MRDLVLLDGPSILVVPRQGARLYLMERGHVISGCRFTRGMNAAQVEITIMEAFDGKVPLGVDIEILMSMHTSLVAPTLAPGQQGIDGAILQRLFQNKPIYIRPSEQIIVSAPGQKPISQKGNNQFNEESPIDLEMEDENVFRYFMGRGWYSDTISGT
ncbi:uncharacterized protein LOC124451718 [Xenia sp. Carnegie-2017]|uniref:uncharacterized protein LOC124451718 n=1 Tax=Xenia sp. Carnegie-2017 TaxID=2897299 RepID=UPI001F042E13|nr:uncharacterized protein LOC124451718 [Xenia sp. Carnegie-2017]